jgi:6-phosphofructokinase 1
LINDEEKWTKQGRTDESGNFHFDDAGEALKKTLTQKIKELYKLDVNVKYIDATYIQRSVPANAADTKMCAKLA